MDDVGDWLEKLGLSGYAGGFAENDIEFDILPELTDADLEKIGVSSLGHRKRLLKAIAALARDGGAAALDVAPEKTASVVPPPVSSDAERRQLTVMFVDLVGSTALSEQLDPEDLREVIHSYQACCARVGERFGSFIARYMGDGMLIYFGYPQAHEDDAERAIRAGLEIVAAVMELRPRVGVRLQVRVGIATGQVVAGDYIGAGASEEMEVVGETPNVAAHLQSLAAPNTVVVAPATHDLAGGVFEYEDLGLHDLKGLSAPVRAWRVVGETLAESRFDAAHAAGMTPLVGREEEINLLLKRWDQAKDGDGQIVLLSGEAGVGKSRILRSFCERLDAELRNRVLYYCSPYHQSSAFYPVINQLERALRFEKDDDTAARLDKLDAVVDELGFSVPEKAPLVASLLSLPAGVRYPSPALGAEEMKKKILETLFAMIAAMASRDPVLVLVEDAHWIDPSTLELLNILVEQLGSNRVMMVVTYRPEFDPPWDAHMHVTGLTLNRLSRRESAAMIAGLLGGKGVPEQVLGEIVAKTDGVPLFVEELTKTVVESDLLEDSGDQYVLSGLLPPLAIPTSLQDSLMARLDRLAPVKEVAQLAATLGRSFSHELLAAVSWLEGPDLERALSQLLEAGLIYVRGLPPDITYEFKHSLVRDVAYQSLLKSNRLKFHQRIAHALEQRFPETEPELLAYHYAGAGLAEKAFGYWRRAAERAIERFANLEAIAHCDKAVAQLDGLTRSSELVRAELEVQLAKGVAVRAGRGYSVPESEQVFLRACELCEELDDTVRLVHALRGLFGYYYVAARWADAARVAERICVATEGLQDRVIQCIRWTIDGASRLFCGEPSEAARCLREAQSHFDESDREAHIRLTGHEMASLILFHLAIAEWLIGKPETAGRCAEEAVAIARRVGQPFSLVQALGNSALLRTLSREWDMAKLLADETMKLSVQYGIPDYVSFAGAITGVTTAKLGDTNYGLAMARDHMAGLGRTGWRCFVPILLTQLAAASNGGEEDETPMEMASKAVSTARTSGELAWESEALRVLAEVKHAAGGGTLEDFEADLGKALDCAVRQGAKAYELRTAISLAGLYARQGKRAEGRDLLAPIYNDFGEGFATPDLKRARELLDELG